MSVLTADPYNRANIERVRRDEEAAREAEYADEQRMLAADREARIALLRRQRDARDGCSAPAKDAGRYASKAQPPECTQDGHINYWADLEGQQAVASSSRARDERFERQTGAYLGGSQMEMRPWYTNADLRNGRERQKTDDQRLKEAYHDATRKSSHDPLKSMTAFLEKRQVSRARRRDASPEPARRTYDGRPRDSGAKGRSSPGPAHRFFRAEAHADRPARATSTAGHGHHARHHRRHRRHAR